MALPQFSMQELIEAGVHFGHKTKRWNPKMQPFLYGARNDIHIIDLQKTVPLLHRALVAVREVAGRGGRVLFVGTKRQATDPIAEAAQRCGQYYINQRWLGGMLTNWDTIQDSIKKLRQIEQRLENAAIGLTKKEILRMERQRQKLEKSLGGIKNMGGLPDLIFVIDTNREDLAVKEAAKLGIPIVAILDSNSSTDHITHPVPGNDDAARAILLYCRLISDAVLDGLQESLQRGGRDHGASAEPQFSRRNREQAREEQKDEKEASAHSHRRQDAKQAKEAKKAPAVVVKKTPKTMESAEENSTEANAETAESKKASTKKNGSKRASGKKDAEAEGGSEAESTDKKAAS